jgi:adenine phosphoribosyltransferase
MQADAITQGSTVVVIDDLIATGMPEPQYARRRLPHFTFTPGGSAMAAGELVKQQGGRTLEYLFVVGLSFLKGIEKLDAPSYVMIESDD